MRRPLAPGSRRAWWRPACSRRWRRPRAVSIVAWPTRDRSARRSWPSAMPIRGRARAASAASAPSSRNLTSEWLLSLGRDGRPEPGLAERWEESADGLTWRFVLRPGLSLHDGTPLDARVVRASIEKAIADAPDPSALFPGLRSVTAVEAVGRARSRHPAVAARAAPARRARPSVPPQGGQGGTQLGGPVPAGLAGPARAWCSAAFPQYLPRRGPASIASTSASSLRARNAWGAMMRGEIDFLYDVPPEALDFVEQSSTTVVARSCGPTSPRWSSTSAHPVLGRQAVRVALNAAVNRAEIIKLALRDRGTAGHRPRLAEALGLRCAAAALRLRRGARRGAARRAAAAPEPRSRASRRASPSPAWSRPTIRASSRWRCSSSGSSSRLASTCGSRRCRCRCCSSGSRAGDYDAFLFELGSSHGLQWLYWFWHSSPAPPFMTHRLSRRQRGARPRARQPHRRRSPRRRARAAAR